MNYYTSYMQWHKGANSAKDLEFRFREKQNKQKFCRGTDADIALAIGWRSFNMSHLKHRNSYNISVAWNVVMHFWITECPPNPTNGEVSMKNSGSQGNKQRCCRKMTPHTTYQVAGTRISGQSIIHHLNNLCHAHWAQRRPHKQAILRNGMHSKI